MLDMIAPISARVGSEAAVSKVADAERRHGKAGGVLVRDPDQACGYAELGLTFIAMASDCGWIASGMARNAKELAALRAQTAAKAAAR